VRVVIAAKARIACLAAALVAFSAPLPASGTLSPVRITRIASGGGNTCAITTRGAVLCWGYNIQGELGHGGGYPTRHHSGVPVAVRGLAAGVTAVAQGGAHGCAIIRRGAVRCWGWNSGGQLGTGSQAYQRDVPVAVRDLPSGIKAIAAGGSHTCVVTSAGGVKCWGNNANGQLGDGSGNQRRTPIDVRGLGSGVTALAAGGGASTNGGSTCALTSAGGVKCWGAIPGTGAPGCCSFTPADVAGLRTGVTAIAAGAGHTCAVTTAGGVKCWGSNYYGELGNGSTAGGTTPVDVVGLAGPVKAVTAGQAYTCALTTAGGVQCWGFNWYGEVGVDPKVDPAPRRPTYVPGLRSGVVAIAAGQAHTCALLSTGGVRCWGYNSVGQLGSGTRVQFTYRPLAVRLPRK
jgi:alpha-tubulin suppressor-like RCC1 family protein